MLASFALDMSITTDALRVGRFSHALLLLRADESRPAITNDTFRIRLRGLVHSFDKLPVIKVLNILLLLVVPLLDRVVVVVTVLITLVEQFDADTCCNFSSDFVDAGGICITRDRFRLGRCKPVLAPFMVAADVTLEDDDGEDCEAKDDTNLDETIFFTASGVIFAVVAVGGVFDMLLFTVSTIAVESDFLSPNTHSFVSDVVFDSGETWSAPIIDDS